MPASGWITMVAIMAIVWGGFGSLATLALRKESAKKSHESEPAA
jgi:hypothetical protein